MVIEGKWFERYLGLVLENNSKENWIWEGKQLKENWVWEGKQLNEFCSL